MINTSKPRATTEFLATLLLSLSLAACTVTPGPHPQVVSPRIGLKDVAVLRSDLQQLGLPNAEVVRMVEAAEICVPIHGETARLEVDRQYGSVRIIEASAKARACLEDRIPRSRLAPAATHGVHGEVVNPPIGLKDEAVLRSDLQQLGLPNAVILRMVQRAQLRVYIHGEPARIEVDRRSGSVRIIEASPKAHAFIQARVPRL